MSDPVLDALDAALSSRPASPAADAPNAPDKASSPPQNDYVIDNNESLKTKQAKPNDFRYIYKGKNEEEEEKEGKRKNDSSLEISVSRLAFGAFGFSDTQAIEIVALAKAARETRWHLDHGERVPHELCAGCRRPMTLGQQTLELADNNRVHFPHGAAGYDCLIRHGDRWRRAAHDTIVRRPDRGWIAGAATVREKQELRAAAAHTAAQQRAHEDSLMQLLTRALGATQVSSLSYEMLRQYADAAGLGEGALARPIERLLNKGVVKRHDDGTGHPTYGPSATVESTAAADAVSAVRTTP